MKPVMDGRSGGDGAEPAFVPSPEWLHTFRAQWTRDLIDAARRYARTQARKVALVRHVEPSYAAELVQDIVGDTLLGVIAWDPERVSLKKHVLDAIKSRTRHDYVHASKFRSVRLDTCVAEAEVSLAEARQHAGEVSSVTRAALDALRHLAHDDREVTLLLDAYDQFVTKKFDVMKLTGLTNRQYRAARGRMERLTLELPASLRGAAIDPSEQP